MTSFPIYALHNGQLSICASLVPYEVLLYYLSCMARSRIAAVTGANKGIGHAIVRNLALRYPSSKFNDGTLLIYLTARDQGRGEDAVANIAKDPRLMRARALVQEGGLIDVRYRQLDVSDEDSIERFEAHINKEHGEGIDILINNAGVALDGVSSETARQTLRCNYHGTLSMTKRFLPRLKPHGRIVNVSSMVGKLNKYSPDITSAFRAAAAADSPTGITKLMDQYLASVAAGNYTADGWPASAYAVSKAGVAGMTICIGKKERADNPGRGVCVNACCPGYVSTDMTKGRGRKSADQGAQTPVKLALGDIGGLTGEFWEHEEVSQW